MRQLVETETGVFQPQSIKWATIPPLLVMLALPILALSGRIEPNVFSLFVVVMAAASLVRTAIEWRKYGKLGKPFLSIQDGKLIFILPSDSRGTLTVPLSTLREAIVYGPDDRRHYRLISEDGSFVEAAPGWSKTIDEAAIRFLQRRLSPTIKVTMKEPQTVFAYLRGDGP